MRKVTSAQFFLGTLQERDQADYLSLLNEFLKEHRQVQDLKARIAQQQKEFETRSAQQKKQIKALTAGLQKINARLELQAAGPTTPANN